MRAVSLLSYLPGLPRWLLVAIILAGLASWVLLVFASGVAGEVETGPAEPLLFGPFRWEKGGPPDPAG